MPKKKLPEPAAINNYDRYEPVSAAKAERAGRLLAELLTLDVSDKEAVVSFLAKHRSAMHYYHPIDKRFVLEVRCAIVLIHEAWAVIDPESYFSGPRVIRAVERLPTDRRKGARRCDVVDRLEANNFGYDDKTDNWWREALAPCAPEFENLTSETIAAERLRRREKNTAYPTIAAGLSLAVGAFGDVRRPKERETAARQRISLNFRNAGVEKWPRSDRPPPLPHKRRYKPREPPGPSPTDDDDF